MRSESDRVHIAHLIDESLEYDHLRLLVEEHDRDRFTLTVATLRPRGALHELAERAGAASLALGATRRRQLPSAAVRLARELRKRRVDVLQTHLFESGLVGSLAGRLALTPLVITTAHHPHELPLLGRRLPLLADTVANRWLAHRVISPTDWMADVLHNVEGVPRSHLATVHHGIDLDALAPSADARTRMRGELGFSADDEVVGTVGRLHWLKDHDVLLRAFAKVAAARPRARLVVVGGGDDAPLRALVGELNLSGSVQLVGHRRDVADILDAVDVVAHAARAESFGLVLLEAAAKSKPLVSTAVGIAPKLITPTNGRLVPVGDVEALAVALLDVLGDRTGWEAMGRASRAAAVHGYGAERMVREHERLYARFLAR